MAAAGPAVVTIELLIAMAVVAVVVIGGIALYNHVKKAKDGGAKKDGGPTGTPTPAPNKQ